LLAEAGTGVGSTFSDKAFKGDADRSLPDKRLSESP